MGWPHTYVWQSRIEGIYRLQKSSLYNEGAQPHIKLPGLENQCWKEQLPQCLAVKFCLAR